MEGPDPVEDWDDVLQGLPGGIDAVMTAPDDLNQVWFFSGSRYVRAELAGSTPGGTVQAGPNSLAKGWPYTLGGVSEFGEGIDAVMPLRGERNSYWVFSGTKYIKVEAEDKTYADTLLNGSRTLRIGRT
ncbi:hypothetical protein CP967_06405 [Streptomyces nitrosporeus]|uniref:Uncharacterized protein n=1 Tax=Streptomyces nitrosporeus TaxID=28894 RepID=A0A5J6F9H0_9ACTN|nr:hypothetical protein [Streptomyces nitrosporeus]QEU71645.1 hypothetical protein CP967_06405 [Streptomyces nitrosporeus]GGY95497.1 hypothetical protein GCM10010327_27820 [Streptomyces nitrosporeus]